MILIILSCILFHVFKCLINFIFRTVLALQKMLLEFHKEFSSIPHHISPTVHITMVWSSQLMKWCWHTVLPKVYDLFIFPHISLPLMSLCDLESHLDFTTPLLVIITPYDGSFVLTGSQIFLLFWWLLSFSGILIGYLQEYPRLRLVDVFLILTLWVMVFE